VNKNIETLVKTAKAEYLTENGLHFKNVRNFKMEMQNKNFSEDAINASILKVYQDIEDDPNTPILREKEEENLARQNESMRLYYAKHGTRGEF
jgi:uncharacterized protein (UPF0147 family)